MDKIQLMTQPEKESAPEAPQERTLQKLKDLVADYLPDAKDEEVEAENTKKGDRDSEKDTEGNYKDFNGLRKAQEEQSGDKVTQGNADAKGGSKQTQDNDQKEDVAEYDDDGFEIPQGKIPLDGHFSTSEIRELVNLSKEEGILKEDINIKVLESNEAIGDKVVISEEPDKNEKNKDGEEEEDDGEDNSKINKKEKQSDKKEKQYKDTSDYNSIDPKDKAKQYQNKAESG